jgi:hypothetical protein
MALPYTLPYLLVVLPPGVPVPGHIATVQPSARVAAVSPTSRAAAAAPSSRIATAEPLAT